MNPIRAKRERLGLSVLQAARRAGIHEKTWERTELGREPKRHIKRKILSALRVPFHRNGEFFPMEPYSQTRYQKVRNEAFALLTQGLYEAKTELRGSNAYEPPLKWTLQGFGMLRYYYPGTDTRLHVWSPAHIVPDVSDMHTHPWNFTSTILSGELTNEVYTSGSLVGESKPYQRQTIRPGEGGGLVSDPEEVWLGVESSALYTPGQRYRMEGPQIHRSKPSPGCVTLCEREQRHEADLAYTFWPMGNEWVSAEPRPATAEERFAILRYTLDVWGVRP